MVVRFIRFGWYSITDATRYVRSDVMRASASVMLNTSPSSRRMSTTYVCWMTWLYFDGLGIHSTIPLDNGARRRCCSDQRANRLLRWVGPAIKPNTADPIVKGTFAA